MDSFDLSIIFSVYNEAGNLPTLVKEIKNLTQKCPLKYEFIFVNDGSNDNSAELITKLSVEEGISNCILINLSKNFGHEEAMRAGLFNARGDYRVCMDADSQHPVSLIPELYDRVLSGCEIVLPVRTQSRNLIRQYFSKLFFVVYNKFSNREVGPYISDFFLVSKPIVNLLKERLSVQDYFIRVSLQNMGFKKAFVEYAAGGRRYGKSSYSYFKLARMAIKLFLSGSRFPLHFCIFSTSILSFSTIMLMAYTIYGYLTKNPPPGYTTIIIISLVFFSVILGQITILLYNSYTILRNTPVINGYIIRDRIVIS